MIELKDCRVKDIQTDNYFSPGCETCDYGSEYVNEIEFLFSDGKKTVLKISRMYDFGDYSYGDLMKLILNAVDEFGIMSKEDFVDFVKRDIERKTSNQFPKPDIRAY